VPIRCRFRNVGAAHAFACLAVLEARRQLDDLAIPVNEGKCVGLLARELCACKARNSFERNLVLSPI
jgi:hypothetical protein